MSRAEARTRRPRQIPALTSDPTLPLTRQPLPPPPAAPHAVRPKAGVSGQEALSFQPQDHICDKDVLVLNPAPVPSQVAGLAPSLWASGSHRNPYRQATLGSSCEVPVARTSPFLPWAAGAPLGPKGERALLPSASSILGMSRYFSATSKAVFRFVSGSS